MKKVNYSFKDYEQILVNYIFYVILYTIYQVAVILNKYGILLDFFPNIICLDGKIH